MFFLRDLHLNFFLIFFNFLFFYFFWGGDYKILITVNENSLRWWFWYLKLPHNRSRQGRNVLPFKILVWENTYHLLQRLPTTSIGFLWRVFDTPKSPHIRSRCAHSRAQRGAWGFGGLATHKAKPLSEANSAWGSRVRKNRKINRLMYWLVT